MSPASKGIVGKTQTRPNKDSRWHDITKLGSWYNDKGPQTVTPSKSVDPTTTIIPRPRLVDGDHSHVSHDRLLFFLNSLDPQQHVGRANDFFNAMDIIVGNLFER
jgi:hypothetical protein